MTPSKAKPIILKHFLSRNKVIRKENAAMLIGIAPTGSLWRKSVIFLAI